MAAADTERPRVTITDPTVMRALAHPARLAIVEHLNSTGQDVTATECAEIAGLSPSATSYHLRALAKAGLVEEAPSRGDGRERVWRSAITGYQIDPGPGASAEARAAEQALVDTVLANEQARIRAWMGALPRQSPAWHEAAVFSNSMLLVTAEELAELNQRIFDLIQPYRRRERVDSPPAGGRLVALTYRVVPDPE